MQRTFISFLMLLIIVVLLALHNAHTVTMDFLLWSFQTNLSVLLLLTFFIGAMISYLLSLPKRKNMNKSLKDKDKSVKELKAEIENLKQHIEQIEKQQSKLIENEKQGYGY